MNVLYLIPHLQNQGPVVHLHALIKNLDQELFSPFILTLFPERENSMIGLFRDLKTEVICGNLKRWQILSQKRLISDTIKAIAPDIVHSCSTITDGLCASLRFKQPLLLTLHNNLYEDVAVRYGKIIGGYLCRQEKRAIVKADTVIPCSNTLKKQYESLIPREYIAIPNGIETDSWTNDTGLDKNGLRQKLGLPTDQAIIISTGALIERKKPLTVIKAFLKAGLQDAVLLILGDGHLMKQCREAANERVIFTGRVGNVKEYLYAADVFISASSSEGMPYAILEAECTGIPMILSDIPQHREALGENAHKVSFFPVGDVHEIVKLLKNEVKADRRRIVYPMEGRTAQAMADRYMKEYKKLLNQKEKNA